ncbi:metal-dependent transcriptional regulator [bacterium]|nr:metal-dependent transcriptional regulator [bacterium]
MQEKLTKSLETYLMAIDALLEIKKTIIVKDVAEYLHFGGATVSDAIKKLKEKGYVNYEPYSTINLTELGEKVVIIKKYRHKTITQFLNKVLDIELKNAEYNAEQIEYSMTDDVLKRLVHFLDFMEQCSCTEPKWMQSCKTTLKTGQISKNCQSCSNKCCNDNN